MRRVAIETLRELFKQNGRAAGRAREGSAVERTALSKIGQILALSDRRLCTVIVLFQRTNGQTEQIYIS
jgi:hypothetical protein